MGKKKAQKRRTMKRGNTFFLNQLVHWFFLQDGNWLTGTDLTHYDTLILSSPEQRPSIIHIETLTKLNHKPENEFFEYRGLQVMKFRSLTTEAIDALLPVFMNLSDNQ